MAWAYVLSKQSSVRSPSSGSDADTEVIGLAVSLLLMLGTETAVSLCYPVLLLFVSLPRRQEVGRAFSAAAVPSFR